MRRVNFDIDVLRSFAMGMSLGSFAKAADRLGRSTSAISAQMKKLEDQAGTALFKKSGRNLVLTDAGETMLAYARRMLDLNDEASAAIRGAELEGWVRLGLQEDFGEALLPRVLGQFVRSHPKVRVEAHVVRNKELLERVTSGQLDLALAWGVPGKTPSTPFCEKVADVPMCWIGPLREPDDLQILPEDDPLALAALEAPCLLRNAATDALDHAGMAWRMAFVSSSLGGLWAATAAGLGLTVRTPIGLPASLQILAPDRHGLPVLPHLDLMLHRADNDVGEAAERLAGIVVQTLHEAVLSAG